jgi:membrane-bound ClpP family serine protease
MSVRLVVAIITVTIEEAALAAVVLLLLPRFDINVPLGGLVALMLLLLIISVVLYRIGSRALRTRPVISLPDMTGATGKVISPLDPEGMVRIKGELWAARSIDGVLDSGREVIVVGQDSLKLVVRSTSSGGSIGGFPSPVNK